MPTCLIGLGANLGDRAGALEAAVERLAREEGVRLLATSRWHETPPAGGPADQPPYLNGAATIETSLDPRALLGRLHQIEQSLGRARSRRWAPRTIDLDLLLVDDLVLETPELVLPHPRMAWRRFVLAPAAEVAASMIHPTTGWSVARLLTHLDTAPEYVALAGGIGAGKTELARRLGRVCSARTLCESLAADRLGAFYGDPASHAWAIELEFLDQRAGLLAAEDPAWSAGRPTVSDFWFDQSLAFARTWLAPREFEVFRARFELARREVARPKLVVLLDVPAVNLVERIRRRDRPFERGLDETLVGRIAQSIAEVATARDLGPVLRLVDPTPSEAVREVAAAVAAMRSATP